jgi:hypothetical protein
MLPFFVRHCVQLISISTLFAFLVVALALIWSRYYEPGESDCAQGLRVGVHLFLLVGASIGAAAARHARRSSLNYACMVGQC